VTLALTRHRDPEAREECWHIYYGDIRAGSIARKIGVGGVELWQWVCGFHPGSHPSEITGGTEATFDQARAEFEAAWRVFLAKRTEADFEEWRYARDFTAWKYAMWDAGLKMPTQTRDGRARCFCGAEINNATIRSHILAAHRATVAP
jgi:hypothetical protein